MTDPITAYLANGGTITKCPPGAASYGYTANCPNGLLPSEVHKPEPPRGIPRKSEAGK